MRAILITGGWDGAGLRTSGFGLRQTAFLREQSLRYQYPLFRIECVSGFQQLEWLSLGCRVY
jgi:hypothetical protein